jgi:hypothetical protein
VGKEVLDLCKALAADLTAQTHWSRRLTARRGYVPRYELAKDLTELQCCVCPGGMTSEPEARRHTLGRFTVHVGILKKLSVGQGDGLEHLDNITELDELIEFVGEINKYLQPTNRSTLRLTTESGIFDAKSTSNDPAYHEDHLVRLFQFTSVLTVNWELVQS